jgi:hypothetical protein
LLAQLPKAGDVRIDQGQHYEAALLMKDAAEEKAERILVRELQAASLTEKALEERSRSEPLKWKVARTMRTETTVSLEWIARRLDLESARTSATKCDRIQYSSPDAFFDPNVVTVFSCLRRKPNASCGNSSSTECSMNELSLMAK